MVDGSQAMVASYRYDPFGNTISSSGTQASANVYRFSSKEIHVNIGIYYYGYRFYDPNLQRWPNRDPIADQGAVLSISRRYGKFISLVGRRAKPNLYSFVRNNPLTTIDLVGLFDGCTVPYGPATMIPPPPDPCNANGGHYEPYWQIMGYSSLSACATAEWDLNRDTLGG